MSQFRSPDEFQSLQSPGRVKLVQKGVKGVGKVQLSRRFSIENAPLEVSFKMKEHFFRMVVVQG